MARLARVKIVGITPYSQSAYVADCKRDNEPHDEYERRILTMKAHYEPNTGEVYIPAMSFKWCIQGAAQYLGVSVPGKKGTKFGSIFGPAVSVLSDVKIGHNIKDVKPDSKAGDDPQNAKWYWMNADGRRGSAHRVARIFPEWSSWGGIIEFVVTDHAITEEAFEKHIKAAGQYIGVGRFRPAKPTYGTYGKFKVEGIKWEEFEGGAEDEEEGAEKEAVA